MHQGMDQVEASSHAPTVFHDVVALACAEPPQCSGSESLCQATQRAPLRQRIAPSIIPGVQCMPLDSKTTRAPGDMVHAIVVAGEGHGGVGGAEAPELDGVVPGAAQEAVAAHEVPAQAAAL
jgi:hypothetical protein